VKIPDKLVIGVVTYTIREVDVIPGHDDASAFIDPERCLILIRKGIPHDTTRGIGLCHEIVHALFLEIGENGLYRNERVVDLLGRQLFAFLEKNRGSL
jgi:hypothetical protein